MTNQRNPQEMHGHDITGVVLLLQVPRANEKKELAAEQMFAALHGLLTMPSAGGFFAKVHRERIGIEIAVRKKRIGFYIWVPNYLKSFVEEQIYAQYPTVQISEVEDYASDAETHYATTLVTEMKMVTNDVLPIKTFQSFEVDPLASITATLAKFEEDEEAWVQILLRPAAAQWHHKSEKYQAAMQGGGGMNMGTFITALWTPPGESSGSAPKLADHQTVKLTAAKEKSQKLAFETEMRIVYRGNVQPQVAKLRLQSIIASYKQFNTTYLNGFESKRIVSDPYIIGLYRARDFNHRGYILNMEEMATLFHLPHTNVETPFILWATSQTAEPPANLPIVLGEPRDDISPIATTNFRGHNTMFGIKRFDRSRHLYIIGQTGVGKSGLLELLTISDIYSPFGFCVIDPHGDYAQSILKRIPAERANDVIYFNPADVDFPMAFNPMEVSDPKLKNHTSSELVGVLKRMFENSWGPRLEYILRYSILALLDYPNSTMLDIVRILTEKKFRNEVLTHVQDPVVRNFWQIEFASWNDKFAAEAVAPILNKVGAFTANPLVRNIIGQPKSSFNIRQIMDEKKILLVNLSRGLVGEDNAALLGALLVTKVQLAAMGRADIPASERHPFYLYVDEFQNFATDSFATILSEARKYGLNLTVANQYTAQMQQEVRDAVFGNVGSMIAFRMGADDSRVMLRYFEPKFEEYDLVHMHNRHFVVTMSIEGEKVPAFSAVSLNLPPWGEDFTDHIVNNSRANFAVTKQYAESYIGERYLGIGKTQAQFVGGPQSQQPRQTGQGQGQPGPKPRPEAPAKADVPAVAPPSAQPARPNPKPEPAKAPAPELKPVETPAATPVAPAAPPPARPRLNPAAIAKAAAAAALKLPLGHMTAAARPPAPAGDKPAAPAAHPPVPAAVAAGSDPAAPKRKRTRKRKRKPGNTAPGQPPVSAAGSRPSQGDA